MVPKSLFRLIAVINFPNALRAAHSRMFAPNRFFERGISINQRSFDLKRSLFIQAMPMDYLLDLKTGFLDLVNALQLRRQNVAIRSDFASNMHEDAISMTLTYVESLRIPWVDQAIDIVTQSIGHSCFEHFFFRPL